jgi:hypothetical protein
MASINDMYLGIAGVTSASVSVTPPAGTTEREDQAITGGRELETFDLHPEATGATGTKTATTGANQSGVAISVALAAAPLIAVDRTIKLDPPGTIGLPTVGV